MRISAYSLYAVGVCAVVSMLAGCGALPEPAARTTESALRPLADGYKQIHSFEGDPDGADPAGLLAVENSLYGTTAGGGTGYGTIFRSISGKEHVLYSFQGGQDGEEPVGLTPLDGSMYGTTYYGGNYGCSHSGGSCGTVFTLDSSEKEHVLYRFKSKETDGWNPDTTLAIISGSFYGATFSSSGSNCDGIGCGTVFEVSSAGKERVIYHFKGGHDGCGPVALFEVKNLLYGVTDSGGLRCVFALYGTFFSVTTSGKERVLHKFRDSADGWSPNSLIAVNGTFYGTTDNGGNTGCFMGLNRTCGVVFSVSSTGKETVVYAFKGGTDGADPDSLVWLKGSLYGTTRYGGAGCGSSGCGTVFKLSTSGMESILHRFKGSPDGMTPGEIITSTASIYGVTDSGGSGGSQCGNYGCGTLYKISP
jgi:uncharacterized repeat protein (TIGR03803 family)